MFSACHSKMERESRRVKKSDEPSLTCFNYLPLVERRVGSVGIIWSSPYAASDTAKSSGALSGPCLRDRTLCPLLGWSPLRNSDYDGWVLSVRSNDEIDTFYDLCSPYLVVKKISFLPSFTTRVVSSSVSPLLLCYHWCCFRSIYAHYWKAQKGCKLILNHW